MQYQPPGNPSANVVNWKAPGGGEPAPGAGADVMRILMRGKWTIVGTLVAALLVSFLYYLRCPNVYQSKAWVLVSHRQANLAGEGPEALTMRFAEEASLNAKLATHSFLFREPKLIGKAVTKGSLSELPSLAGAPDPVSVIGSGLNVRRATTENANETTNILELTYSGSNPDDTQKILHSLLDAYQDYLKDADQNSSGTIRALLTKLQTDCTDKLATIEREQDKLLKDEAAALEGEVGLDLSKRKLEAVSQQILELNECLRAIHACRKVLKGGMSQTAAISAIAALPAFSQGSVRALEVAVPDLGMLNEELELVRLESRGLGPNHPDVKAAKAVLDQKKRMLGAATSKNSPGTIEDRLAAFERVCLSNITELEPLKAQYGALYQKAREFAAREKALDRDQLKLSEVLSASVNKLNNLNLTNDIAGYHTDVLRYPSLGGQTEPNFYSIMSKGVFFGLVLGVLFAYLIDVTDKSFHSPDEIRNRLGMAVLGHVPVMTPGRPGEETQAPKEGFPAPDHSLVAFHRSKSRMAEAYRAIRTAIYFGTHGSSHKVIQITSPHPGDGKSTLSCNLAVSIAQSGKRVLLIDADFRRPRVHKLFNVTSRIGMSAVTAGTAQPSDAIMPTTVDNLFVMPCGAKPDNPAELLTSPRFGELLAQLRKEFDFVLVDTPPLLAVTDPCAVAPRVDGVILTIRVAPRSRATALRAAEMLQSIDAKVLGVVVNGVGRAGGAYGDASGYQSYQYAYGSRHYRYSQEYYIGGNQNGSNHYGYDDDPTQKPARSNGKTNGSHPKLPASSAAPTVVPTEESLSRPPSSLVAAAPAPVQTAPSMDEVPSSTDNPMALTPGRLPPRVNLEDLMKKWSSKKDELGRPPSGTRPPSNGHRPPSDAPSLDA